VRTNTSLGTILFFPFTGLLGGTFGSNFLLCKVPSSWWLPRLGNFFFLLSLGGGRALFTSIACLLSLVTAGFFWKQSRYPSFSRISVDYSNLLILINEYPIRSFFSPEVDFKYKNKLVFHPGREGSTCGHESFFPLPPKLVGFTPWDLYIPQSLLEIPFTS